MQLGVYSLVLVMHAVYFCTCHVLFSSCCPFSLTCCRWIEFVLRRSNLALGETCHHAEIRHSRLTGQPGQPLALRPWFVIWALESLMSDVELGPLRWLVCTPLQSWALECPAQEGKYEHSVLNIALRQ